MLTGYVNLRFLGSKTQNTASQTFFLIQDTQIRLIKSFKTLLPQNTQRNFILWNFNRTIVGLIMFEWWSQMIEQHY